MLFLGLYPFFPAFSQGIHSVLITEIMADPSPVVGLPDAEYLELYNPGKQPLSLKGWQLGIGDNRLLLPDSVIRPGEYLILCSRTRLALLSPLGRALGLTSFSLANGGASLVLRNDKGALVYAVSYKDSWWPADKREGGYALEMVDSTNPCAETGNWSVSVATAGGTPGRGNSVQGTNPDLIPPLIERIEVANGRQLAIYANERLDSLACVRSGGYELKGRQIQSIWVESPAFRVVSLELDQSLTAGQRYEVRVKNLADCAGNTAKEATFTVGLPLPSDSGDVILNEILYDPRPGGVEFVEIYNRTDHYISLKNWSMASLKDGQPAVARTLGASDLLLAPYGYMALTSQPDVLQAHYPTDRNRTIVQVSTLPALTNGHGGVALYDADGKLYDLFEYDDDIHAPLLASTRGVSLERRYPERRGNDPLNWHSAAAVVGYATPGYGNSQGIYEAPADGFVVEPEVISPNGDGVDDVASIRYLASSAGLVATLRIYDVQGRLVRNLIQNQTIGTNGDLRWDGTDEQGRAVQMGYYLLLIATWDQNGNQQQLKKRIVVAYP